MLEFAARHKVEAAIEEMELTKDNLEHCIERLEKGDVRYSCLKSIAPIIYSLDALRATKCFCTSSSQQRALPALSTVAYDAVSSIYIGEAERTPANQAFNHFQPLYNIHGQTTENYLCAPFAAITPEGAVSTAAFEWSKECMNNYGKTQVYSRKIPWKGFARNYMVFVYSWYHPYSIDRNDVESGSQP
ncbi:hypothetical protein MRB53_039140 [Persea americana]|nr:hypothetical protein MRB53_039140 [Persea americana]